MSEIPEQGFRSLVENAAVAIAISDLKGRFTYVNQALADLLGYSTQDLIGRPFKEFLHPDDRNRVTRLFLKIIPLRRKPRNLEFRVLRKDGHVLYLMSKLARFIVNDKTVGFQAIVVDITKRKNAEDALRKSEKKSRTLLENLPQKIFFKDKNSVYVSCNENYARDLGIHPEEITGKTDYDFYPKKLAEKYRADDKRIMKSGKTEEIEEKYIQNGQKIYVHTVKTPVRDENDHVVGILGIFWDITEHKRIESALKQSEEKYRTQFEEALDAIFLANAETGIILDCNRAAAELVGREKSELIGKHQRILHPPEKNEGEFSRTFKQHLEEKEGQVLETQVITKNGELRDVAIKAKVFELGGKRLIQGIFRDITGRKQWEDALQDAKEKWVSLTQNTNDIIIITDSKCVIQFINKTMPPYTLEETIGKTIYEYVPREQHDVLENSLRKVFETGKPDSYEISSDIPKTCIMWFSTKIVPIKHDGKVSGAILISTDITERKRAEEELIRLSSAVKMSTDSIVIGDLDAKIIDVNEATLKMYGTDEKADLIGKNSFDLITPKEREKALAGMKEVLEKGYLRGQEYHIITKDGARIPVEMSIAIMKDADSKPIGFVSINRDITERKNAEKALLESQQKFERLFKNNPDASVYVDANERFVDANSRFVKLFGYSLEEAKGKVLDDLIVQENKREEAKELTEKSMEGYIYYETTRKKKNETLIPVSISAAPIYINHQFAGCVVSYRDITERVQMQKKLEEYSQQLEEMVKKRTKQLQEAQEQLVKNERLAAVGQVAAMVGHDLRNPLTGISGAVYYLKKKLSSKIDKTWKEMLTLIEENVIYSNKIISDLLEYSREIKLELTKTTPKSIIKEALSSVKIPVDIQILDTTKNTQNVTLDIQKMKRVFINIIKNAIEAMPNGGTLKITSAEKDGNLQIVFSDTGLGITRDALEKVWAPFFTTKAKGMGLGLPICKRIVEAHEGNILIKSTLGKGTTLTITSPLEPKIKENGGEKAWASKLEFLLSTTTKA